MLNRINEAVVVFINGILSRKFILFVTGTLLFIYGKITGDQWLIVAGIYVGANIIESGVNKFVSGSTKNNGAGSESKPQD